MKNIICILAVLGLALTTTVEAQAGLMDLFKKDKAQKDHPAQAPRYDHFPAMDFFVGTLRRGNWTDWQLDDATVELDRDCATTRDGAAADLREGSQAIVMGARVGDKIIAYRVRVLEPQWAVPVADNQEEIRWSTTDPTVGEGTGPN